MKRTAATTSRLDASITDAPTFNKAQWLMATLQAGNADLFRGALDILDWCVREVQEGRRIASIDPQDDTTRARQFSTPLLEAARLHNRAQRIELHSEAFDQVVHIINHPSPPTDALRALMAAAYSQQASVAQSVTEAVA